MSGSASFRSVWKSISGYFLFADESGVVGSRPASNTGTSVVVVRDHVSRRDLPVAGTGR